VRAAGGTDSPLRQAGEHDGAAAGEEDQGSGGASGSMKRSRRSSATKAGGKCGTGRKAVDARDTEGSEEEADAEEDERPRGRKGTYSKKAPPPQTSAASAEGEADQTTPKPDPDADVPSSSRPAAVIVPAAGKSPPQQVTPAGVFAESARRIHVCSACADSPQAQAALRVCLRVDVLDLPPRRETVGVGPQDVDPWVTCEHVDSRHALLRLCQRFDYQFDSLRRAKYSTVQLLRHLLHRTTVGDPELAFRVRVKREMLVAATRSEAGKAQDAEQATE